MLLSGRSAAVLGAASCVAVVAGLVVAGTPTASAPLRGADAMAPASAQGPAPVVARPPLGRSAAASNSARAARSADTSSSSPWTPLQNPPPFGTPGTMLLESNGDVLVHNEPDNNVTGGSNTWWQLAPDSSGSYIDGTWSQIASMPASYSPLYFASAVLPDGRMIVEGGEYIGENAVWSNEGAIYNPVTNRWSSVAPPPGWTSIGDAASEVLANGTFMLQHPCNTCATDPNPTVDDALLNARNLTWTVIPGVGKDDPNDEEGWTLEPSGQVLTLDTWVPGATQLFDPRAQSWSFLGNTAADGGVVDPFPVVEIGPQVEMPGGNTFVVGAGTSSQEAPTPCTTDAQTQTALFNFQAGTAGTWTAGPAIPAIDNEEYDSTDGPGSVLPDGNVLFDASACVYNTPTHFFLYNANSNTISQIPDVPNAPKDTSFATRMLDLPNGQVLFNDGHHVLQVYTAGGTPKA